MVQVLTTTCLLCFWSSLQSVSSFPLATLRRANSFCIMSRCCATYSEYTHTYHRYNICKRVHAHTHTHTHTHDITPLIASSGILQVVFLLACSLLPTEREGGGGERERTWSHTHTHTHTHTHVHTHVHIHVHTYVHLDSVCTIHVWTSYISPVTCTFCVDTPTVDQQVVSRPTTAAPHWAHHVEWTLP